MAHVHGEKMVEAAKKVAEEAICPFHAAGEMMGQGGGMSMGGMMGSGMEGMKGMGGMMEHGTGMGMGNMMGSGSGGAMMGSGMGTGAMMNPGAMTAGVATGAAMTATSATGRSLLRRIVTHPLVLFGAGVAIGYLIHKYREEIIQKAGQAAE